MQFPTLLATLLLMTTAPNSDGYDYQQTALQQYNRPSPVYGPAPLSSQLSAPCTKHTSTPTALQVPILTALVRTLEPSDRNYEVKLFQSNHLNLVHAQPPQHAAISGPPTYYSNNHQSINTNGRYLPPTIPYQPSPHQQALHGVSYQQYGSSAADAHVSYTAHQNPLLTPQYIQRFPPTSLTPPPPQSQTFTHHGNQQQQQPFAGVRHGPQKSNSVANSGIAPNSQFSSATQSGFASASIQGVPGNYISQSEVGQLDHYFEKQNPVGDTRAFTRLISTCYPDGHCEQQQLDAGQVDQRHQHVVLTARTRVQPVSDKCRALSSTGAMAPISVGSVSVGSASQNSMKRPPNRRLYPYTEVVIPHDPFN